VGFRVSRGTSYYAQVLRRDPCSYCGVSGSQTIDHIHPRNFGGANHWRNYTAACAKCNRTKGSQSLLSFLLGPFATGTTKKQRRAKVRELGEIGTIRNASCKTDLPDNWFDPLGDLLGISLTK